MTRTFLTARKTLTLKVRGARVILKAEGGARPVRYARSFRNRYTLRKFLTTKVNAAINAGFIPVVG